MNKKGLIILLNDFIRRDVLDETFYIKFYSRELEVVMNISQINFGLEFSCFGIYT